MQSRNVRIVTPIDAENANHLITKWPSYIKSELEEIIALENGRIKPVLEPSYKYQWGQAYTNTNHKYEPLINSMSHDTRNNPVARNLSVCEFSDQMLSHIKTSAYPITLESGGLLMEFRRH